MYYPIIDKLKEVMADITSVKEKEPLVIEGTLTSQTGGTWQGNYSDIQLAFTHKKPVYFTISIPSGGFVLAPLVMGGTVNIFSCIFPYSGHNTYGIVKNDNTFSLHVG